MNTSKILVWLCISIAALSLVAAGAGIFWSGDGKPVAFTSLHGQTVQLYGRGLYHNESVAIAAQAIAQDVVTLVVGLPMLVASMLLFRKGSLRGKLLLAGTLGYFLYTFGSYAFTMTYNPLFLVYTLLFTFSLYAFILSINAIDVVNLPNQFSDRLPRHGIIAMLYIQGTFLLLLHLGRIIPALLNNSVPVVLESYTTLVIAVLDAGLLAPTSFVAAFLLGRKMPWGYLLGAVLLIKGLTLATAVSAMVLGEILAVGRVDAIALFFPVLTTMVIYLAVRLLMSVKPEVNYENA